MGDSRRGLDWIFDLLTTYTHDSELQAITEPSLISTIHKSPQHMRSLSHPAVSSPAVPWQRLLTMDILQLPVLRSSLSGGSLLTTTFPHRLPYATDSVASIVALITLCTDRVLNILSKNTHTYLLPREHVYQAVA
jgi:hypothetical protein